MEAFSLRMPPATYSSPFLLFRRPNLMQYNKKKNRKISGLIIFQCMILREILKHHLLLLSLRPFLRKETKPNSREIFYFNTVITYLYFAAHVFIRAGYYGQWTIVFSVIWNLKEIDHSFSTKNLNDHV